MTKYCKKFDEACRSVLGPEILQVSIARYADPIDGQKVCGISLHRSLLADLERELGKKLVGFELFGLAVSARDDGEIRGAQMIYGEDEQMEVFES